MLHTTRLLSLMTGRDKILKSHDKMSLPSANRAPSRLYKLIKLTTYFSKLVGLKGLHGGPGRLRNESREETARCQYEEETALTHRC